MYFSADTISIPARWRPVDYDIDGEITLRLYAGEKKRFRKRPPIKVSAWAERHRVVVKSRTPGRWRNSTAAYLAGIMDAAGEKCVETVGICAGPQSGKTEAVNTFIGYAIDRAAGDVLIVYPNENDAKENSTDRIQPMITSSRRLNSYTTGYADDLAGTRIKLEHMVIYLGWATSASRLANRPCRYVVFDETDKYPETTNKKEADPISLGKARAITYRGLRKYFLISTPTTEGNYIWQYISNEASAVFDFWVKCPECGGWQKMAFSEKDSSGATVYRIKVPEGERDANKILEQDLAWYECAKCGAHWDDATRDRAVRDGQWRDRKYQRELFAYLAAFKPKSIGFHIPAWISPFVGLSEIMSDWFKAQNDKTKLKDFQNKRAAEPWRAYEVVRKVDAILKLRDDRPRTRVPGGGEVACLTAGVDTQDAGFWYSIRAWGWGGVELLKPSWCIRAGYCLTFEELARILWSDQYTDAAGHEYVVRLTVQDRLGHRTREVDTFCLKHRGKILPSQGKDVMAQPVTWSTIEYYAGTSKAIPTGLKAVNVNTKYFKDELSRLLLIDAGDPSAFLFYNDFPEAYADQYTVEYPNEKGLWECPKNKANHLWDCDVLNLVAHELMGVYKWPKPETQPQDAPPPEDKGGGWIKAGGLSAGGWINRR